MARKSFNDLDLQFYIVVFIIILVFFIATRMLLGLLNHETKPEQDEKHSSKKWTHKQIKQARQAKQQGPIKDQPGWTEQQKNKAKQLGLLNDREWTQDEHELARQNGLLNGNNNNWSHAQLQKAKQLNLI
jgi:hypothetical protein